MSYASDKKFMASFENQVQKVIKQYNLLTKDDKIIVACSGGKDSTTVLYLLKKIGYDVKGLFVDLKIKSYSNQNLENIKSFCKKHKIKLHVTTFEKEFGYSLCKIKSVLGYKYKLKSCSICGVLRRYVLNKKTRELGATKIVTGHNIDDEAQTILMNILKGDIKLSLNFGPRTGLLDDKKFVPRIKPLYFCEESGIRRYSQLMGFPVIYERCPCGYGSFRSDLRKFLNSLESEYPGIKKKIVLSFMKKLPSIRSKYGKKSELIYCQICGEPSRNNICSACEMIRKME
jgi:uncharacterized protein (TIGR00269 family)